MQGIRLSICLRQTQSGSWKSFSVNRHKHSYSNTDGDGPHSLSCTYADCQIRSSICLQAFVTHSQSSLVFGVINAKMCAQSLVEIFQSKVQLFHPARKHELWFNYTCSLDRSAPMAFNLMAEVQPPSSSLLPPFIRPSVEKRRQHKGNMTFNVWGPVLLLTQKVN